MTISLQTGDMTADEKPESSHEYNFFLDRQLQNKLIDCDEQDLADPRFLQNVRIDGKTFKAQARCEEVTGWIYDSKINFRKPDKESSKQPKEFIQPWKDYKSKQQRDETFNFKHYGDIKKYIQQYREEHSYVFGSRPPGGGARSDIPIGELRKYLNHHHSAPTPSAGTTQQNTAHQQSQVSTVCTQCNNNANSGSQQLLTASMYYTNRKDSSTSLPNGAFVGQSRTLANHNHSHLPHGHQCSKHNHVNVNSDQAYKYKLAPDAWRSDSVQSVSVDSERNEGIKTPRIASAKADRGKSPTKVMVPAGASNGPPKGHPLQTVTVQARQTGGDNSVQTNGSSRTLDTLACVAAEKQRRPFSTCSNIRTLGHVIMDIRPSTVKGRSILRPTTSFSVNGRNFSRSKSEEYIYDTSPSPNEPFSLESMDNRSDISLSKLSTTCLGAEMRVRMTSRLEPSCTYHLFPTDSVFEVPPIVLNTAKPILWHPSISSPGQIKTSTKKETLIASPFKGFLKVTDPSSDDKSKTKNNIKKDGTKVDFPEIRSKNGMVVTTDINLSDQAKFKTIEVTGQGEECQVRERNVSSASLEKTSKLFCTKNLRSRFAGYIKGKKTRGSALRKSASATAANRNSCSAKVVRSDRKDLPESLRGEAVSPGLNFWKEEQCEAQNEQMSENAVPYVSNVNTESMKRVAEYILRESSVMEGNASPGVVNHHRESNSHTELSPREGIEPDFPVDTAGLTWCERLELLRAVNKRPEKTKQKPPRIRFFKDPPKENPDTQGPLMAQSTRAHLYEQRRMKHLLEQAKVKGTDQFEWLTENSRFRSVSSGTSDSSDDDYEDLCSGNSSRVPSSKPYGAGMDVNNAENALLQRYNMPLVVKGGGWKMTPYPSTIRSHTSIFQS